MLSFFIYIVKVDARLWGCSPNQASLHRGDETREEKSLARWPANCPTNQSSESWGTHPVREDTGGREAARFSTHGEAAKESCSAVTVLRRVSGSNAARSAAVRPVGTASSPPSTNRTGKVPFVSATAQRKSTTCGTEPQIIH